MPRNHGLTDLQDECRAAGLPVAGNKDQMTKRLKDDMKVEKSNVPSEGDSFCDAVLAAQAKLTSDKATKNVPKVAPRAELSRGEHEIDRTIAEAYVGNRCGLDLMRIKKELDIQKAKTASHNSKIASLEDTVDRLDNYVSTMRLSLKEYQYIRMRFITTYKRDKLNLTMTPADHEVIREGKINAHTGDAAIDSLLYEGTEGRHDFTIFTKLYGIHPFIVREIKHKETLALWNLHAEVEANTKKTGTKEFYEHFRVFVTEFQESDLRADYLSSAAPTAVTQAYRNVLRCHKYQEDK